MNRQVALLVAFFVGLLLFEGIFVAVAYSLEDDSIIEPAE